ncbi:MAG TPA: hotdog fold domain-containing protein [Gemmatimonadaceae bacterium]|nr:hotdog fold domain-containing protein [Gemmatimonadaceae bacterium]
MSHSPGPRLLRLWRRLSPLPGGKWLFARIFRHMVPYSGSVAPTIEHLEPGYARVEIPDRRANRQHLGSVHAIALLNVAEQASGLAMLAGLPDGVRGIVTGISMTYHKKARGPITAVSRVQVPTVTSNVDFDVEAECLDREDNIVARATVRWRLGPIAGAPNTPQPTQSVHTASTVG